MRKRRWKWVCSRHSRPGGKGIAGLPDIVSANMVLHALASTPLKISLLKHQIHCFTGGQVSTKSCRCHKRARKRLVLKDASRMVQLAWMVQVCIFSSVYNLRVYMSIYSPYLANTIQKFVQNDLNKINPLLHIRVVIALFMLYT